ncbi:hypothetical protein BDR07DRAFT_1490863 [Suillus spraguei]|nr:hypothetical protein BDR07DRAFT_1490863 [Suillus spraguei]
MSDYEHSLSQTQTSAQRWEFDKSHTNSFDYEGSLSQTHTPAQRRESDENNATNFEPEVVEHCLNFIINYQKQRISKAKAVLGIQQVLAAATSEGDPSFDLGFAHDLEILDSIRDEEQPKKN